MLVIFAEKDPKVMLHHIFALTVLEDYLYWTDWETKSVERCHKYNGTDCSTLTATVHRPMDIHVYHPLRQVAGEIAELKFLTIVMYLGFLFLQCCEGTSVMIGSLLLTTLIFTQLCNVFHKMDMLHFLMHVHTCVLLQVP